MKECNHKDKPTDPTARNIDKGGAGFYQPSVANSGGSPDVQKTRKAAKQ